MFMSIHSRFSFKAMVDSKGAPKGELAIRRPIMAAPSITTAAFLSDFIELKYPGFGNIDFTWGCDMKHSGNSKRAHLKH
jgi:hypothetical protein